MKDTPHAASQETLSEALAAFSVDHDHPAPERLAAWIEGAGEDAERRAIDEHLAGCSTCRALVRDVVGGLASIAPSPARVTPHRPPAPRRPERRRWLAIAATSILAVAGWHWLSVDPRLTALGVDPIASSLAERRLAADAARWLDGDPIDGVDLDFGSFTPATVPARAATQPPIPLSPRFEALVGSSVEWRWHASLEATELLVIDHHDELVLRHRIDPAAIRRHGTANAYGPIPEMPALDPETIYAWKVNAETATGEVEASEFVPFRVLPADAASSGAAGDGPLLAAVTAFRTGAHSAALRWLEEVPGPEEDRAALMRVVLERQRLPAPVVADEIERRLGP
ncbi:MAG: zf-HC2 domain-containing protein [Acidobacteriota bacterium]